MKNLKIQDLMTTDLVTVNGEDSLTVAADIFKKKSFHHLSVVNNEGCLDGILSLTDMDRVKSGFSLFRNPNKKEYDEALFRSLRISEVMTKGVVNLQATDNIQLAYEVFKENKFRALPVLEKGILVGILSPLDILKYVFEGENS